jgi:hypothetical protein
MAGSWDMSTDRPGELGNLSVAFKAAGELKAGSRIALSLPHTNSSAHQRSWTMKNAKASETAEEQLNPWGLDTIQPSVTCTMSSGPVSVTTTTWNRFSGMLVVMVGTDIPEGGDLQLLVAGVGTPSSVVGTSVAILKTLDGSNRLIDGPLFVMTEATTVPRSLQKCSSALTFLPSPAQERHQVS